MVRFLAATLLVLATLIPGPAIASAASEYTCNGGAIPAGTYTRLIVAGDCTIPSGTVVVHGGVTVLPGKALNASGMAGPNDTTLAGGNMKVWGGISVGKDGILLLGCSPSMTCVPKDSLSEVHGGIRANQALAVILHGNTIWGRVSIVGGGGGLSCAPNAALSAAVGIPVAAVPAYSTLENNTVYGGVTVSGLQSCWFGAIRNTVRGTVSVTNNKMADPDANEVVTNTIRGSLLCSGNDPKPQVGDSAGTMNKVTGSQLGQCAVIK